MNASYTRKIFLLLLLRHLLLRKLAVYGKMRCVCVVQRLPVTFNDMTQSTRVQWFLGPVCPVSRRTTSPAHLTPVNAVEMMMNRSGNVVVTTIGLDFDTTLVRRSFDAPSTAHQRSLSAQ